MDLGARLVERVAPQEQVQRRVLRLGGVDQRLRHLGRVARLAALRKARRGFRRVRRAHRARIHQRHADAIRRRLRRQGLGQAADGELGGAVGAPFFAAAVESQDGRNIEHVSAALRAQARQGGAKHVQHAEYIHVEMAAQRIIRQAVQRARRPWALVVDHHVQPAESGDRGIHRAPGSALSSARSAVSGRKLPSSLAPTASSSASPSRDVAATLCPCASSSFTRIRPSPADAPVTNQIFGIHDSSLLAMPAACRHVWRTGAAADCAAVSDSV